MRGHQHFLAARALDVVRNLAIHQAFGEIPVHVPGAQPDALHLVESAQNVFVGLHAQRAQEDRAEELALAVDAHVQDVLAVVLELHPGAAVRNDLAEEVRPRVGRFVEHAGRTVQLADDHALGAVDDKGAVVGHQRNVAEEYFLFLDVADVLGAGIGVLVVYRQPDGHFQRRGIGHAALLALHHVVLQLHAHRVAALVAERRRILVERAALRADHVAGLVRVGHHRGAAIPAGGAQVVQTLQIAALTLPVADRIIDEIELRQTAKILDRKHRAEHRLQPGILALRRQQIHLQEPLVGHALDFDQVRYLNRTLDLRKVQPLALADSMISITHFYFPPRSADSRSGRPSAAKDTTASVPSGTRSRMPVPGAPVA